MLYHLAMRVTEHNPTVARPTAQVGAGIFYALFGEVILKGNIAVLLQTKGIASLSSFIFPGSL